MTKAGELRARVSMESGLEDRNNQPHRAQNGCSAIVSMESGLEDRNNDSEIEFDVDEI